MAVVGVVRGKQANVVPLTDQLVRESFNVAADTARIRVRVRRYESYAHPLMLTETPGRLQATGTRADTGFERAYPVAISSIRKPISNITGPESFVSEPTTVPKNAPQIPAMNAG